VSGELVSVVMPACDEEAFIAEALASVLAQTYRPLEIIVVDDGSRDRTAEIAAAHGARVLRRPHQGAAAACNAGLHHAQGAYWAIFDADDVMASERLARQVDHLRRHPEHGLVLGWTEAFTTPGEPRPPHYNPAWDDGPFPACTGTMLARRAVFDAVGRFDITLPLCYDLDWLARANDGGVGAGRVDHVVLRYRIHRGNVTADRHAVNAAMLGVVRESLRRRGVVSARD
jgi:glycosyltransferase involved in cell wall biosynthesis